MVLKTISSGCGLRASLMPFSLKWRAMGSYTLKNNIGSVSYELQFFAAFAELGEQWG